MVLISDYIKSSLEVFTSKELAEELGISISMLSAYKKSYNPSLAVALKVYKRDSIVLHPFAEGSLQKEIGN